MIRLLTVEAITLARLGYAAAVSGFPDLILAGQAATAAQAHDLIASGEPDVVTVDADLPDGGLALAGQLHQQHPQLGVVLTGPADDTLMFAARDAGLSAYLPNTTPLAAIVDVVRRAANAPRTFVSPALPAAIARQHARDAVLSPREQDILTSLQAGDPLTVIAEHLGITESTVHTHITRLCQKLHVTHWRQALAAAQRHQLI